MLFKRSFAVDVISTFLTFKEVKESCTSLVPFLSSQTNVSFIGNECSHIQLNLPLNYILRMTYDVCDEKLYTFLNVNTTAYAPSIQLDDRVFSASNRQELPYSLQDKSPVNITNTSMTLTYSNLWVNGNVNQSNFVVIRIPSFSSITPKEPTIRYMAMNYDAVIQFTVDNVLMNATVLNRNLSLVSLSPLKCRGRTNPIPLVIAVMATLFGFAIVIAIFRYFFLKRHPGANPEIEQLKKQVKREEEEDISGPHWSRATSFDSVRGRGNGSVSSLGSSPLRHGVSSIEISSSERLEHELSQLYPSAPLSYGK